MTKGGKQVLLAVVLGMLVPWLFLSAVSEYADTPDLPAQTDPPAQADPPAQTNPVISKEETLPVLMADGTVCAMDMTEYLTGVLLCEMPVDFELEAKKAQAIVARTYAMRTVQKGIKHSPEAVCTQSSCCQGYISPWEYIQKGGTWEAVLLAREAVCSTQGIVLTYNGELIDATYFSCSGGKTEDALAVWGSDVPYLRSVDSPGEERAAHYTDTVSYTSRAFQDALGVTLSGTANSWFGEMTYTDGGGVATIQIGDTVYTGIQLRSILGLRSTAFTLTATADSVVITTRGFGHRVGMSQYGADAMAAQGAGYAQILTHYYYGTVIDKTENLG